MPYPPLSRANIDSLNELYDAGHSISEIRVLTGLHRVTIKKYVGSRSNRIGLDTNEVVRIYRINGTLNGTAAVLNTTGSSVWRHLTKAGVTVGNGANDSIRLYKTLRRRVSRSEWRQCILDRDLHACRRCETPSNIVHHIKRLSLMRDEVAKENPSLNPFGSYQELRAFTDAVMLKHTLDLGEVLCRTCHEKEHE